MQELPSKQPAQDLDGQEETVSRWNPASVVQVEPTPGDDAVQVGVKPQVLAPGVQDRSEADVRAEVFGISSEGVKRGRSDGKQQPIDDTLVL